MFAGFEVGGLRDVEGAASDQANDLLVEYVYGLANVPDALAIFGTLHA